MSFYCIYVREAHPEDEWQVPSNWEQHVLYHQPTSMEERTAVAQACVLRLNLAMPMLLDAMTDEVDRLYAAWPERLYVIDPVGVITYRGDPGPWGFDVAAWEQAIQRQLPTDQPAA